MACRSGPEGQVISFEPCPFVYDELDANVARWKTDVGLAPIHARQLAISRVNGEADLQIPSDFDKNHGMASLESNPSSASTARVRVERLDEILGPDLHVGVMKIDVEGHELGVLEGAASLLANRQIRDIIFEEHGTYPTPAQKLLQSEGYRLYRLSRTLLRPLLNPCDDSRDSDQHPVGVLANFLATIDDERAQSRFSARGWKALSGKL
jgi:FkbM family methyltransferase